MGIGVFDQHCSPASVSKQKSRRANVYLAGISRDNDSRAFQNSLSGTTEATTRNW